MVFWIMSKKQRGSTGESSSDEEDPYIYYLTKFLIDEENNYVNEVIDMCLKTWTTFDKEERKHFVLFPAPPYGPKKREDLHDRLENKKDPKSSLRRYEFRICGHASK